MKNLRHNKPLYEKVYEEIKNDILSGKLKTGERLISKRSIAEQFGVSVVTAESAIAQLIAEGYITAVERSGYFIRYSGKGQISDNNRPSFLPEPENDNAELTGAASLFPFAVWVRLMRSVILDRDINLMKPISCCGVYALRKAISDCLYRCRGIRVDPKRIIIGAGSEYLYNLIIQLLGRKVRYAVEDPCYDKIVKIYNLNDVKLTHIKTDRQGISIPELKNSGAEVIHITPAHRFPSGSVMPIARRSRIMKWAEEKGGRYIIEDDYDSEFRCSGLPVPTMYGMDNSGRVIYINTFSQTLTPSLRISYMCLPEGLIETFKERLGFCSCTVPAFEQYTLAEFINGGYFERHINRVKKYVYKNLRRITEVFKAENVIINESSDGLHFTAVIPENSNGFIKKAESCGIVIRPISLFCHEDKEKYKDNYIISYANADVEKLNMIFGKDGIDND